jgi:hypothetical protein
MKIKTGFVFLLGIMLLVSCSEDTSAFIALNNAVDQLSSMGIYKGEWRPGSRNSVVIGEGLLTVKKDSMEFILPEEYIVSSGLRFWYDGFSEGSPDEPLFASPSEPIYQGTVQHIHYIWQGASANANYVEIEPTSNIPGQSLRYGFYSFEMTIDRTPYRVDLQLTEKVTSMYDVNTKMWTIMIPLDKIAVVNLKTDKKVNEVKPILPILVFNSTKKIL